MQKIACMNLFPTLSRLERKLLNDKQKMKLHVFDATQTARNRRFAGIYNGPEVWAGNPKYARKASQIRHKLKAESKQPANKLELTMLYVNLVAETCKLTPIQSLLLRYMAAGHYVTDIAKLCGVHRKTIWHRMKAVRKALIANGYGPDGWRYKTQ